MTMMYRASVYVRGCVQMETLVDERKGLVRSNRCFLLVDVQDRYLVVLSSRLFVLLMLTDVSASCCSHSRHCNSFFPLQENS